MGGRLRAGNVVTRPLKWWPFQGTNDAPSAPKKFIGAC